MATRHRSRAQFGARAVRYTLQHVRFNRTSRCCGSLARPSCPPAPPVVCCLSGRLAVTELRTCWTGSRSALKQGKEQMDPRVSRPRHACVQAISLVGARRCRAGSAVGRYVGWQRRRFQPLRLPLGAARVVLLHRPMNIVRIPSWQSHTIRWQHKQMAPTRLWKLLEQAGDGSVARADAGPFEAWRATG